MRSFLGPCLLGVVLAAACRKAPQPNSENSPSGPSPAATRPLPDPLPNVAATVNGQPIWIRIVTLYVQKLHPHEVFSTAERAEAIRHALERCIDRELLFQEAVSRKLTPSESEIQAAYETARLDHPDDAEWENFLEGRHLTNDLFRVEIRTEKTVALLLREDIPPLPPISEVEARTYYDAHPSVFETGEQIRARQLVIENPLINSEARLKLRRELLPNVLQALRSTGDFVTVARRYGTQGSWEQAGQPLVLRRSQLPEAVADAAFKLKAGEMTDFIDTRHGFELVKVEERLPSQRLTYEEAAPRLKKLLSDQRSDEALQKKVEALRNKARIERFL